MASRFYRIFLITILLVVVMPVWGQQFRMVTFNIRYADGDRGKVNCWENRRDSLFRFLDSQHLSIIDMQEVLHEQMTDCCTHLEGYGHVGVGREDGKTKGEYAPIFYNKKDWKAVRSGSFWLSETPEVAGSMGWDAACTRLATWALLKRRHHRQRLIVVNTHFDHMGHVARIESAKLIIRKIKEISADTPFILTGDFNVDEHDEVYSTLTTNSSLPIVDTQKTAVPHLGATYTFHNFGRLPVAQCEKIDFVFTSPAITTHSTFIPAENRDTTPAFYMSDHNPVLVDLSM